MSQSVIYSSQNVSSIPNRLSLFNFNIFKSRPESRELHVSSQPRRVQSLESGFSLRQLAQSHPLSQSYSRNNNAVAKLTASRRPRLSLKNPYYHLKKRRQQDADELMCETVTSQESESKNLISKSQFNKIVREIIQKSTGQSMLVAKDAFEVLHAATESYAIERFAKANKAAYHAHRITVRLEDLNLVEEITQ